ncbi:germin-like protein subfamily 1 member 7 [Syzygium oleosum]|uniref:germin-like protein subfamily 1 member 7 n=1 Tax=Syzygium oleosum TaxID=219896 RepID=UPI0011D2914D|nr:germin-like protein subfamily 1 member 7 [Syzygium oleosum]
MKFLPISFLILALATATAFAYDPSPLQDICVATNDQDSGVFVNGKFCKDPKQTTADDFLFMGFRTPGNTSNPLGSKVTQAFVNQFPGLNTLGISMARIDFAPGGLNPPHTHPRGTEVLVVVEGTLLVGFVTSNQLNNTLFTKVLYKGDMVVFPIGLIHFELNIGNTYALAFSGLSSQNPGAITIANAVFGAKPPVSADVLTKAFQVDKKAVDYLQALYWFDNSK